MMKLRGFLVTTLCCLCLIFLLAGCGKPGGSTNNLTNSFVTIVSLNENAPLVSDVLTDGAGTDDVITVTFQSDPRQLGSDENPTDPDGTSPFDTITLRSYHVEHIRSDGGPNPADFTAGTNVRIEPDSEANADVVVVRGFDKHRSPLEELRDDGQIFTTSIITFYGEDGYGNDIAVDASLVISFANYPDR
ncbi:MAG: hypothetical protein GY801_26260 [bacterium]|nr:hypothetical protein [bacterium]